MQIASASYGLGIDMKHIFKQRHKYDIAGLRLKLLLPLFRIAANRKAIVIPQNHKTSWT